jgi:hypothetical protein
VGFTVTNAAIESKRFFRINDRAVIRPRGELPFETLCPASGIGSDASGPTVVFNRVLGYDYTLVGRLEHSSIWECSTNSFADEFRRYRPESDSETHTIIADDQSIMPVKLDLSGAGRGGLASAIVAAMRKPPHLSSSELEELERRIERAKLPLADTEPF